MICRRCLNRSSALRMRASLIRSLSTTNCNASAPTNPPAEPSSSTMPSFSTPLSASSKAASIGEAPRSKSKALLPISIAPAGTTLMGLNYIRGKEDPVALPEEDYPEWLWTCLDTRKNASEDGGADDGDEFSKSKKQRRMAAKRQKKLEARLLASGNTEALIPKVPLQLQTIDLPTNEEGSVEGALEAVEKRGELTRAMRGERRLKIKERNFLKGM